MSVRPTASFPARLFWPIPLVSKRDSWSKRVQERYNEQVFRIEAAKMFSRIERCPKLTLARAQLLRYVTTQEIYAGHDEEVAQSGQLVQVRDCARCLRSILSHRADEEAGFSVAQAIFDIANNKPRPELKAGFFAELIYLIRGVEGRAPLYAPIDSNGAAVDDNVTLAQLRSQQLDEISTWAQERMGRFRHGLEPEVEARRQVHAARVQKQIGASESEWNDWQWQTAHVVQDPKILKQALSLSAAETEFIERAQTAGLPFGVTPFYLSLMHDPKFDQALRAQVLPSKTYVSEMEERREKKEAMCDFMREGDTSPIDLITRRYPSIAILKPYNTCPQICIYCQRNWEIDHPMATDALAPEAELLKTFAWLGAHPAVREVLITGGDPLALEDEKLKWILDHLSNIEHIERFRIGSRTPVTLPMRITEDLAELLGSYRKPGVREVALVTHIEHAFEINPQMVEAIDRLRKQGLSVYNQLVFTFYNSRRFETAFTRRMMRKIGVEPYYTFNTKGKEETGDYRVPIARLAQEAKEEARLLPGLERTDEAVYNIPGLGKNYLRAWQHRDVLSIQPDGARIYEFHPWEKNIVDTQSFLCEDLPILDYLERLDLYGEDPDDYESIWYYF